MPHDIVIKHAEIMYNGFNKITKYYFEFSSFDGLTQLTTDKEIFERKSAVGILLYDPKLDAIVMIQQFRPGCFVAENIPFPLEIPAGLIDSPKENLEDVARREAKEEARCHIKKLIKIGYFFPEISFSSRRIYLFCGQIDASNLEKHGGLKEENEDTRIALYPLKQVKNMLKKGEIINSHSLIALQWFFLNLRKIKKEFCH